MKGEEDFLARRYPDIPWREPIPVQVPGLGAAALGCRICIALRGMAAQDVPSLPRTQTEFEQHLATEHGLEHSYAVRLEGGPYDDDRSTLAREPGPVIVAYPCPAPENCPSGNGIHWDEREYGRPGEARYERVESHDRWLVYRYVGGLAS